jgi:hypothetical protein
MELFINHLKLLSKENKLDINYNSLDKVKASKLISELSLKQAM